MKANSGAPARDRRARPPRRTSSRSWCRRRTACRRRASRSSRPARRRARPAHWRSARRPCGAAMPCFLRDRRDRVDLVERIDGADLGRLGDRDRRRRGRHARTAGGKRSIAASSLSGVDLAERPVDRRRAARRRTRYSGAPHSSLDDVRFAMAEGDAARPVRPRPAPANWPPCRCRRRTPRPRARRSR